MFMSIFKRNTLEPEEDIGIIYFSSSSDKNFMLEQKQYPERYEYYILGNFETREEAVQLEVDLHKLYDVKTNDSYYNKANQTSTGFDTTGVKIIFTEEHCKKIGEGNKGKYVSEKTKQKQSEAATGKRKSPEHCANISKSITGRTLSPEHCANISKGNIGHIVSSSTRIKISKKLLNIPKSKEACENMSIAKQGKKHPYYGKKRPKEACENISKGRKGIIFSEEHCKNISKCQKGKRWFVNIKNKVVKQLPDAEIILSSNWQLGRKWKENTK